MSTDGREGDSELTALLRDAGVSADEIADASEHDLLSVLAVSRFAFPDEPVHTIAAAADVVGVSPDRLEQMWLALGFPKPRPGEAVFADADIDLLRDLRVILGPERREADVVLNVTRVLGASMARIAESQTELITRRGDVDDLEIDLFLVGEHFARLMERVWRRHLVSAAHARLQRPCGHNERTTCVGFADLVGFTSLSQQLDVQSLAGVVERFEHVAFATIAAHGGLVVKMIGDEVMFEVEDPVAAARCSLALSASYHEADDLSDVRVGLARGEVVEREGDLFGPTVNIASRITGIALPGTVVVDEAMHDRLRDSDLFALRSMLPRRLKHIGRVPLYALRDADGASARDVRELRRARRRARLEDED